MRHIFRLVSLCLSIAIVFWSSAGFAFDGITVSGSCGGYVIEDTTTTFYVKATTKALDLTLDPGSETVEISVSTCTTIGNCELYYWDHDGDGTKDRSTLDGIGATFTRGVRTPNVQFIGLTVVGGTVGASPTTVPLFQACPAF